MEDMWKHRRPPTPINYPEAEAFLKDVREKMQIVENGMVEGEKKLKDQKSLSLGDNIALLLKRCRTYPLHVN